MAPTAGLNGPIVPHKTLNLEDVDDHEDGGTLIFKGGGMEKKFLIRGGYPMRVNLCIL